jgi:hypothetical protein
LLSSIAEIEENLITIYQDQNNAMKDELNSMRGANMFSSFYGTLKNMNEYHHKYPNTPSEGGPVAIPEFEVCSHPFPVPPSLPPPPSPPPSSLLFFSH